MNTFTFKTKNGEIVLVKKENGITTKKIVSKEEADVLMEQLLQAGFMFK